MKPFSTRLVDKHRGPADSRELNEMQKNMQLDIARLFNELNKHGLDAERDMNNLIMENYYLQRRIRRMERKIGDIESTMEAEGNIRYMTVSFEDRNDVIYTLEDEVNISDDNQAQIDSLNGIARIPTSSTTTKTYTRDSVGDAFIPHDLEVKIYEEDQPDPSNELDDDTIYEALKPDRTKMWTRIGKYPQEINELYIDVHIKIPYSLLVSRLINYIDIHPFPDNSLTLLDVQYKDKGKSWRSVPTFPGEDDEPEPIEELNRTKFKFPEVEAEEVRIRLKQPSYMEEGDTHTFAYGLHLLEVGFEEYLTDEASMITPFSLEDTGMYFQSISSPEVKAGVGGIEDIDRGLSHTLYYEHSDGQIDQGEFNTNIPIEDCQKVYIKTDITQVRGVSPLIDLIGIEFSIE